MVAGLSVSLGLLLAGGAGAAAPNPNPWLQRHFLNMAHQGGEDEAPSNTLYAFKSALAERGADTLELDVNLAEDDPMNPLPPEDRLMVIHDDTVNRTTEVIDSRASGNSEVNDLTVAQVQDLDAGYTFRPGHYDKSEPPSAYPYRGVRNGSPPPPPDYSADDFRIPTMREVLNAFPDTPINIEIKLIKILNNNLMTGTGCVGSPPDRYCDDATSSIPVADALAALLDEGQYASRDDIIVVSFSDELVTEFHAQDDPPQMALAPATADAVGWGGGGITPTPDVAAFQVPPVEQGFKAPELLLGPNQPFRDGAHQEGYAVHVWTNGDQDETDASYAHLYGLGVDGIMSSNPGRLASFLCANHVPRPDGTPRGPNCVAPPTQASTPAATTAAAKQCKKHRKLKRGKCVKKKRKHRHR